MFVGLLGAVLIVVFFVIVVILLTMLIRTGDAQDTRSVRFVSWAALALAAVFLVTGLVEAVTTLVPGSSVTMTVPIAPQPITLMEGVKFMDVAAHLDAGAYTSAEVTSTSFSTVTRVTGGIGTLLVTAVPVMICVMVWIVCRRLLAGSPFAAAVSRIAFVTAGVVLVAGFAGAVLLGISTSQASWDVFSVGASEIRETPANPDGLMTGYPQQDFAVELPMWPLGAAFIIAVFATIVQFGAGVQSRRDALEVESAALRRDTNGLV